VCESIRDGPTGTKPSKRPQLGVTEPLDQLSSPCLEGKLEPNTKLGDFEVVPYRAGCARVPSSADRLVARFRQSVSIRTRAMASIDNQGF
jgi:hypothetical protein